MSFTGRTAVVTGGSRGIGRAICLELARRGANVVFSYAGNTAAAEATRKELEALGVQTRAVQGSVADPAAVKTLIDTAVKELGSLDILVNNAGITRDNLAMMLKEEDFDAVIETNLKGAFLTMKAAARPMMKARYGRIVNLSSVVALRGNPGQINYCASKAGLIGMTKSLAKELGGRGVAISDCNQTAEQNRPYEKQDNRGDNCHYACNDGYAALAAEEGQPVWKLCSLKLVVAGRTDDTGKNTDKWVCDLAECQSRLLILSDRRHQGSHYACG